MDTLGPKKTSYQEDLKYQGANDVYISPLKRRTLSQNLSSIHQEAELTQAQQMRSREQHGILARISENHDSGVSHSRNESSKTPSRRRQYQYYFD